MTGNSDAIAAACASAGALLARMRAGVAERAAAGGPEAVAEAAWAPGGPDKAAIAVIYTGLRQQAAGKPAA